MIDFNKKRKILFALSVIVLSVLLGINIYFLKINIQRQSKSRTVNATVLTENDTKKDCNLILETKYKKCGHTIIENKKIDSRKYSCIADIEKDYKGYEATFFSSDKIIMHREVDKLCPKHYIIKDHNGYVTVYWEQKDGNDYKIKEMTNIRVKTLSLEEQQLLSTGIKAYGDELYQRLEDLNS